MVISRRNLGCQISRKHLPFFFFFFSGPGIQANIMEYTGIIWRHVRACSALSDSLQPHGLSVSGSSVHGLFQEILEQVAISYSRGSSQPRDWTHASNRHSTLNRWSHINWNLSKCAKNDQSLKPFFLNLLSIPSYKLTSFHPLNKITTLDKSSVLPSPHLCLCSWMWPKN